MTGTRRVSIPYSTIKIMPTARYTGTTGTVSIPYSTIKIAGRRKCGGWSARVSIPYSTIKIAQDCRDVKALRAFQFLIVRLK